MIGKCDHGQELGRSVPGWASGQPAAGATWDAVRVVAALPGIADAEPLLFLRLPSEGEADDAEVRRLGSAVRRRHAAENQRRQRPPDWSLRQMKVLEAWQIWHNRPGAVAGSQPGAGIRVAHPDTGYGPSAIRSIIEKPGRNFRRGGPSPTTHSIRSTATGKLESPGHGTGTCQRDRQPQRRGNSPIPMCMGSRRVCASDPCASRTR